MNLKSSLKKRHPNRHRPEALLRQACNHPRYLSASELEEPRRLYRCSASELALARRNFPDQPIAHYFNQLVGCARDLIYQGEPLRWKQLLRFDRCTFPQLYRALLPYPITAFVLFWVPAIAAFWTMSPDQGWIYVIQGPDVALHVARVEQGELWTKIASGVRSAAAGFIMTDSFQVMFLTFAGGLTASLLTLWVRIYNGLALGSTSGSLSIHHLVGGPAKFVLAHGPTEFKRPLLARGCGLCIGDGLLRPDLLSRDTPLRRCVRIGVQLIWGSVPLPGRCRPDQGFISPSTLPWSTEASVGLITDTLLHLYRPGVRRHAMGRSPDENTLL